jgi:hypothetical protein
MRHPTLGRFIQRDPLGYVDGMSVYALYAVLRSALDPSGSACEYRNVDGSIEGFRYVIEAGLTEHDIDLGEEYEGPFEQLADALKRFVKKHGKARLRLISWLTLPSRHTANFFIYEMETQFVIGAEFEYRECPDGGDISSAEWQRREIPDEQEFEQCKECLYAIHSVVKEGHPNFWNLMESGDRKSFRRAVARLLKGTWSRVVQFDVNKAAEGVVKEKLPQCTKYVEEN